MKFSNRINSAINTAAIAHADQLQKGSNRPYITHPFAVATIISKYTDDEDAFIAALFHDILEDAPDKYSQTSMQQDFGDRVVQIVQNVSEEKNDADGNRIPWQTRKDDYHRHLETLEDKLPLMVTAADKIHNLTNMITDYNVRGERFWEIFNAPKDRQLWNFQQIYAIVKDKPIPTEMINDFGSLLDQFKNIVEK